MCAGAQLREAGGDLLSPPPNRAVPLKGVPEPEEVLVGETPKQTPNPEPPRRAVHGQAGSEATGRGGGPLSGPELRSCPQPCAPSPCPEPVGAPPLTRRPRLLSLEMRVWIVNAKGFSRFALFPRHLMGQKASLQPAARLCAAVAPEPGPPRPATAGEGRTRTRARVLHPRRAPLSWALWRQTPRPSPLKGTARAQAGSQAASRRDTVSFPKKPFP